MAMRIATEAATSLSLCPEVESVLLCGSLAQALRGNWPRNGLFGDIDLIVVGKSGWEKFRVPMQTTVELGHLVTKKLRFEWANEATRRGAGHYRPSPLDPYRLDTRPELWARKQNLDGDIEWSPLLDVFVFPPGWIDINFDEVVGALGTSYFIRSEFYGGGKSFTWDSAEFLRSSEAQACVFDLEAQRFVIPSLSSS